MIAEAERIRAEEEAANEAKLAKSRASLALIQLIQSAIERREALLRQMGEEPGLPASQAGGNSARTPVSRLALERHVDQALAREDLESVDLAAARLDMSELLHARLQIRATRQQQAKLQGQPHLRMRPRGRGHT